MTVSFAPAEKILSEVVGLYQYIGITSCGTPTSYPQWQIMRVKWDNDEYMSEFLYADGNAAYDNIWDDRLTKEYS